MSELFARGRAALAGFRPVKIGLSPDRELLYRKLEQRAVAMFERGLVEEVRGLLASGIASEAKPFESLGYAQALSAVRGKITREQAIESTQQETRRYAKRQLTWFRKERDLHWLSGFGDQPGIQEQALALIRAAL
jgi:tRNA dimethylallyltransferase